MSRRDTAVWPPLVWASLGLVLTVGFGLGGTMFALGSLGLPLSTWCPEAEQAHGHMQIFGWAGLMVLGLGSTSCSA